MLMPTAAPRLRCRHCHLTIRADDIGEGPCPECLEATGRRQYDFEPVSEVMDVAVRYRCEDCGAMIDTDRKTP
ncbi:MAG: hypothetical protein JEZ11_15655 [Desulfobacterales bacterium]|nr:hypothetical protein [Desulfobacterales bacterium]